MRWRSRKPKTGYFFLGGGGLNCIIVSFVCYFVVLSLSLYNVCIRRKEVPLYWNSWSQLTIVIIELLLLCSILQTFCTVLVQRYYMSLQNILLKPILLKGRHNINNIGKIDSMSLLTFYESNNLWKFHLNWQKVAFQQVFVNKFILSCFLWNESALDRRI